MHNSKQTLIPLFCTVCTVMFAGCGAFFEPEKDGESHFHDKGRDDGVPRPPHRGQCRDGGVTIGDTGIVVTPPAPDAEVTPEPADAGMTTTPPAPDASEPPVSEDAGEEPPPEDAGGGDIACRRDSDCPAEMICNHPLQRCEEPPVFCTDLHDEAACLARTDCVAIYGGMNCRDVNGGDCEPGDVNCTCETYSFAACIDAP